MQGNSSQPRLTTLVFPLTQVLMSRIVAIFFHIFPFSACLNQLVESVGLPDDDMDSASTSLPPQTELQQRTVSQQRTTGHLLRFLCLLNLCSLTTYLFTSFSAHRPAQRECARTGLRSHVRCHPCPIPQPVKVGHTTGVYDPYSFRIVMWVLLRPTRTNP